MTSASFSLTVSIDFNAPSVASPSPKKRSFYREGSDEAYEGIKELGEGGFGVVWEAFTPRKAHRVAMKIPYSHQAEGNAALEAKMLQRVLGVRHALKYRGDFNLTHRYFKDENGDLSVYAKDRGIHSHVILTDVLSTPDTYAMFIQPTPRDGATTLSSARILNIGIQGLETLQDLQSQNLAHLDLKPENMAYNEVTEELTICDFGTAQSVEKIDPSALEGTPSYRAPEQMLFKPYDASVDVWGLAVTLFELYTARPLIAMEVSENANRTTIDYLHIVTQNLGPLPATFIQSVSGNYNRFFKKDGSIAGPPSEKANEILKYFSFFEKQGEVMRGKKIPIWEARIYYAAYLKKEKFAEAEKLIAFLKPMLRYEKRISPEEALKKVERAATLSPGPSTALRRQGGSPSPRGVDPASYLSNCGQKLAIHRQSGKSPSLQKRVLQISTEQKR